MQLFPVLISNSLKPHFPLGKVTALTYKSVILSSSNEKGRFSFNTGSFPKNTTETMHLIFCRYTHYLTLVETITYTQSANVLIRDGLCNQVRIPDKIFYPRASPLSSHNNNNICFGVCSVFTISFFLRCLNSSLCCLQLKTTAFNQQGNFFTLQETAGQKTGIPKKGSNDMKRKIKGGIVSNFFPLDKL